MMIVVLGLDAGLLPMVSSDVVDPSVRAEIEFVSDRANVYATETQRGGQLGGGNHRLFDSCLYPNYAAIERNGCELADMVQLLGQWSRLELEDPEDHAPS